MEGEMADQIPKDQIHEILFMNLVLMFQTSAMQHMGKLKHPVTDKIDRNMEQAQMSIDILDMLKAKTKNSLSEHETTFLDRAISELKLNYVDEMEKDTSSEEAAVPEESSDSEGAVVPDESQDAEDVSMPDESQDAEDVSMPEESQGAEGTEASEDNKEEEKQKTKASADTKNAAAKPRTKSDKK